MTRPFDETPPHLLVVDDDDRLQRLLERFLCENGFLVSAASSVPEARAILKTLTPDMLVLDVMMPGESGLEFTQELRTKTDIPILMLTAMGGTEDRITGLEYGVDDYLGKPFEPRELLLRINSILRRIPQEEEAPPHLTFGAYLYDPARNSLTFGDTPIHLSPAESSLLAVLSERPGDIFSREELGERTQNAQNLRTIDVQVTRLRKKIEADPANPRHLLTIRGKGYRLLPDEL